MDFFFEIEMNIKDFGEVACWCKDNDVSLVVVGPEDPLANGIADALRERGKLHIFYPVLKIGPLNMR